MKTKCTHNLNKEVMVAEGDTHLLTDFGGGQTLLAQFLDLFLNIFGVKFQP